MSDAWLALVFESLGWLAPEIAAVSVGFAFPYFGQLRLTPAGARYLERLST